MASSVSDTPWAQFSQSDYSPQQWQRAALIDTEEGSPDSKDRYKLPVREPSGAVNRNAVHAAAARLDQVQGVSADKKATAARQLLSLYRNDLGEDPPDSLGAMAGDGGTRSAPDMERVWASTFIKKGDGFSPVEVRSTEKRTVGGYASVFNSQSQDLGGFGEIVLPSFFNKTLADGAPGVICRFNHQDNFLLGTTRSRTLRLTKDNVGLFYEADLPQCRGDVYEMVSRGDVANSSFAFQCYEDEWRTGEGGYPIRQLVSGRLIDVAPVTTPAYPSATVGLRSLARHVGAPIEDVVKKAECNELRGFFIRTDHDGAPIKHKPAKSAMQARMEIMRRRPEDPIGK